MKVLRSSPFSDLAVASALHFFILSCWLIGAAAGAAFRHSDMKALRSSPFLSPASVLQAFIFSCCGVSFFSSAARPVEQRPIRSATATLDARRDLIVASWSERMKDQVILWARRAGRQGIGRAGR